MSNPAKRSNASDEEHLEEALVQSATSRLWLFALLAAIVGILILLFAERISNALMSASSNFPGFNRPTVEAIGTGLISSSVVMFGFEFYARKQLSVIEQLKWDKALQGLSRNLSEGLLEQISIGEVQELKRYGTQLNAEQLVRLSANALGAAIGDVEMARAFADQTVVRHRVSSERWKRLEIHIAVRPSVDVPESYLDLDIKATFVTNSYPFVSALCYSDIEMYRQAVARQAVLWSWYHEATAELPAGSPNAFTLISCTVDGNPWKVTASQEGGVRRFGAAPESSIPDSSLSEHSVSVQIQAKLQRRGHCLWFDVPRVCNGVQYSFDFAMCGFKFVNVIPAFDAPGEATVWSHPGSPQRKFVEVRDWVAPKGGVIFVWVLTEEFEPRFTALTRAMLKRIGVSAVDRKSLEVKGD